MAFDYCQYNKIAMASLQYQRAMVGVGRPGAMGGRESDACIQALSKIKDAVTAVSIPWAIISLTGPL